MNMRAALPNALFVAFTGTPLIASEERTREIFGDYVSICAMWLTGFDAPSCSTVYLDKPMRNHTLMQTIARANRVYPGKHSGVIVDYANVFESLEKALALYGTAGTTRTPVRDKDTLADDLQSALASLNELCSAASVELQRLEAAKTALSRLTLVAEAANALLAPDERRKAYLAQAKLAERIYTAIKPHRRASEFAARMATVSALAEKIRETINPERADITDVLRRIGQVLDNSIEGTQGSPQVDLSRIDFKALEAKFKRSQAKNLDLERLKAAIRAQLDRLIEINETRVDFRQKFESLIEDYNSGATQIEQLFHELLKLTTSLTAEEARHVREQLTEEELVVFDLLTRPGPDLSTDERNEVKTVARQLLAKLSGVLTLDWQKTAQARARDTIEAELDDGLPRAYAPDVFKAKAGAVFQHVYDKYSRVA